jgi:hypothetical protein
MGVFVGIPQDSPEFGAPSPIGLRLVGQLLAPVTDPAQRTSMRRISERLDTLVPIEFDAELLNPSGREPHKPVFRVKGSAGCVISTRIFYSQAGRLMSVSDNLGAAGGDFGSLQLGPGLWDLEVRRTGIGNGGYVRLSKSFRATVSARAPSPPPPTPRPVPPAITAAIGGPPSAVVFTVTGTGFLRRQTAGPQGITVRFVDGVDFQSWVMLFTGSDENGGVRLVTDPLDTTVLPRNAFGQAIVHVSATDSRRDPTSTPANEPLWSNTVTFRF